MSRYCKNCGNQLGENSVFCTACGTKWEGAPTPEFQGNPNPAPQLNPVQDPNKDFMDVLKSIDKKCWEPFLLMIFSAIFVLTHTMKVSAYGYSETLTYLKLEDGFVSFLMWVVAVLSILGVVPMVRSVMDMMHGVQVEKINMDIRIPIAAAVCSFFLVLFAWSKATGVVGDYLGSYSSMVSVGFTFTGWMQIICAIAAPVSIYLINKKK